MPVSSGIKVQQSRFAVLKVEDAVESDSGEEGEWRQVGRGKPSRSPPKQRETHAAAGVSKTASKNAKRRAKKRQSRQSTSSEVRNWAYARLLEIHAKYNSYRYA